jgi:hypothetical protein
MSHVVAASSCFILECCLFDSWSADWLLWFQDLAQYWRVISETGYTTRLSNSYAQ